MLTDGDPGVNVSARALSGACQHFSTLRLRLRLSARYALRATLSACQQGRARANAEVPP
jgi:hypothetical protein